MTAPEQPSQDFSNWKAPAPQESERTDWIVERDVRFDPALPEPTRKAIMGVLTERQDKQDWGGFATDTRTWFEHHGIGSTAVPTPDVFTPYAILSGKMTPEQVTAQRTGVDRFLEPGLDPKWLKGEPVTSEVWDARLEFADPATQKPFTEFAAGIPPEPETQRIYVGLKPMEFDPATSKVRMPKVSSLGFGETALSAELQDKVSLKAFRISDSWFQNDPSAQGEQFEAWVDKEGLRFEHSKPLA
jgi:hypothetical protein